MRTAGILLVGKCPKPSKKLKGSDENMAYTSYDHDSLQPAQNMRIERTIYFREGGADISGLAALPVEQLRAMREESAAAEQVIYDKLREASAEWEAQAGQGD